MDLERFNTSLKIGLIHYDTAVKPSGTQQSLIKYLRSVGRRKDKYSLARIKTVHLRKKLVKCLLPLVIAASEPRITALSYRIYLIYEYDAGRILGRILKQIPYPRCSDTYIHFNKIGTRQ